MAQHCCLPKMSTSISSPVSPQALAPASCSTINRVSAPSPTSLQTPSIFTNKEWIVPPRPKPGRKPAADAPPTKRKAQNRAAQRAFRERRAARVGELEEQMQQMEEDDERARLNLRSRIQQLEADLDRCNQLVISWSCRYHSLEQELIRERRLRSEAEEPVRSSTSDQFGRNDTVPLRPKNAQDDRFCGLEDSQTSTKAAIVGPEDTSIGCGNCSIGSRCECIEQVLDISSLASEVPASTSKRPHSPISRAGSKKSRQSSAVDVKPEEQQEIDFTEQYSIKRPQVSPHEPNVSPPSAATLDTCGFCQDGTTCVCSEMAAEERQPRNNTKHQPPDICSEPLNLTSNPCINGPGSCQQCRSDANSTLFCKSLAANRNNTVKQPPAAQSLCTSNSKEDTISGSERQAITGISISCADAYATLSRHPAYGQASQDLDTWVPKLAAIPGGAQRPAFEVEAASVMQTLKFFDRRFGRDA